MNRLDEKVAIVTGGGSGLGKATCELLAEAGAKVVVTGRNLPSVTETSQAIIRSGGEAIAIQHDVSNEEDWQQVIDRTLEQFGQLDVLVNNAGVYMFERDMVETSLEQWRNILNINLEGTFLGTRFAIEAMRNNKTSSSIINISSIAGFVGGDSVPYSSSKGAVVMLSKSAAVECGSKGYDIRVNTVSPGGIRGGIAEGVELPKKIEEGLLNLIPLGRHGKSIDIAKGVLFLASDDSNFINGQDFVIDGGLTLGCGLGLLEMLND